MARPVASSHTATKSAWSTSSDAAVGPRAMPAYWNSDMRAMADARLPGGARSVAMAATHV